MKCSIFLFIQFVLTSRGFALLNYTDCIYDENTLHLEYICDGDVGERYNQRTLNYLYCNNYSSGIIRSKICILSFHDCKSPQRNEYFGLYPLKSLRIFNISSMGVKTLNGKVFETNEFEVPIRNINEAHHEILELHSQLFLNQLDLESIDISNNRNFSIENDLFSSNKQLKSLNLNNNRLLGLKCDFLLTILVNSIHFLKTDCPNENAHIQSNIAISSNESAPTPSALKIANGQFEWIFSKMDFTKEKYLN